MTSWPANDREWARQHVGYQDAAPVLPFSPPLAPVAVPHVVIAFTGLAGAGKTTAAKHLVNRHGFQRVRFAGPLKAMMAALGLTEADIEGANKEAPCDLLGGKTPRWAMQTLGTEWGRELIAPDIWINAWRAAVDRLPIGTSIVVDDCRFPNEVDAVHSIGGYVVRIDREGAGTTSVHASEQHQLLTARTLENSGAETALHAQIETLLRDISWIARAE